MSCFKAYDIRGKPGEELNLETQGSHAQVGKHVSQIETIIKKAI